MAAKKNIDSDVLRDAIKGMRHYSKTVKYRKFTETVEIHFGLKNFDPARDKRIAGSTELPHPPRQKFAALVLGNEKHMDQAKEMGLDFRSLEDLKKVNRDKKIVKKMGTLPTSIPITNNVITKITLQNPEYPI